MTRLRRGWLALCVVPLVACSASSTDPSSGASTGTPAAVSAPAGGSAAAPPPAAAAASATSPGLISDDDPRIRYSPFSWRDRDGEHRSNPGAQFVALVRSSTIAILVTSTGTVAYRVNGGAWKYAPGNGRVPVEFDPAATWATNLLEVVLTDEGGSFTGLAVDRDGSLVELPDNNGPRILALGDSITQGGSVGPAGAPRQTNALLAYPAALRDELGAEVGVSASGGRGWLTNNPLQSTWANLDANRMDFSDPPDVVVVMVGGGEPDDPGLADAVRATLRDMLATLPAAKILVLGHTNRTSPATTTINAAVRSFSDPRVRFVDAAPWIDIGTDTTTDTVHHSGYVGRAIMAPRIAAEVRRWLAGG